MGGGGSNKSASVASGMHHQHQHSYSNAAGHMKQDEEVFASSEVHTVGQVKFPVTCNITALPTPGLTLICSGHTKAMSR